MHLHFPLRAVSWLPGSCRAGHCWHAGSRNARVGPYARTEGAPRGRTGVQARGRLRWVICSSMRFVVACESRLTLAQEQEQDPGGGQPTLHTGQIYTRCPPPPPCDPAHSSTQYIF
ncbi:hypothetical protein F5883DRAFT_255443 [Diaporthe sp. PMI_573]|nr:hypothetical protein F5883DRAFT_255443 [Diaporthaceae sp. PMI_573]